MPAGEAPPAADGAFPNDTSSAHKEHTHEGRDRGQESGPNRQVDQPAASIQIYTSPSHAAGLIPAVEDHDDGGNADSDDDDPNVDLGGYGMTLATTPRG